MSARIPPGFAELWVQFNTPGDVENMFTAIGVDLAAGSTVTTAVVNRWVDVFDAAVDDHISSSYSIGASHAIVGQDGGDLRIDGDSASRTGLGAATGLPPNTALLVRKITASGGRRGRGRMYVPGLIEGDIGSDGAMSTAQQAVFQSDYNAVLTNLVADVDIDALVLFHDTAPFTPTPITALTVQRYAATQRRRLRP